MKDVRPTAGRVLLALFSILGEMGGVSFLDLFAGTGRVGIEALKRGASPVVMVEVLKDRVRDIERGLPKEIGPDSVVVLGLELRRAMTWLDKRGCFFDVVFADPPYHQGWGKTLLHVKFLTKIVKREGVLVVEHALREPLEIFLPWTVTDVRSYGETALTFLKNTEGKAEERTGGKTEGKAEGKAEGKEALS
ncbi:MAG: RsmD family RNA methyltransferase [Synergistaceae bacterium]|jgi:16S rRNA (guanine(966)-N(2))-methyltransferase RsmD|nr:RsmD family RNA methyltransferase [Synergistaceae bacterium]